jgi:hypothetical protein
MHANSLRYPAFSLMPAYKLAYCVLNFSATLCFMVAFLNVLLSDSSFCECFATEIV